MNDKQVEYTKQEIKRYSEEIDDLWFKINRSGLFAFLGTGLAIAIFAIDHEQQSITEIVENLIGITSAATTTISAVSCVKRIVNRESLKNTVRLLEHDIAMSELEEKPKVYTKTIKENHG